MVNEEIKKKKQFLGRVVSLSEERLGAKDDGINICVGFGWGNKGWW